MPRLSRTQKAAASSPPGKKPFGRAGKSAAPSKPDPIWHYFSEDVKNLFCPHEISDAYVLQRFLKGKSDADFCLGMCGIFTIISKISLIGLPAQDDPSDLLRVSMSGAWTRFRSASWHPTGG
jgi:hypothetical protein